MNLRIDLRQMNRGDFACGLETRVGLSRGCFGSLNSYFAREIFSLMVGPLDGERSLIVSSLFVRN